MVRFISSLLNTHPNEGKVSPFNIMHREDFKSQRTKKKELQEVLKFSIEIFWNLEASLKSELLYFKIKLWNIDKQRNIVHIKQFRRSLLKFT